MAGLLDELDKRIETIQGMLNNAFSGKGGGSKAGGVVSPTIKKELDGMKEAISGITEQMSGYSKSLGDVEKKHTSLSESLKSITTAIQTLNSQQKGSKDAGMETLKTQVDGLIQNYNRLEQSSAAMVSSNSALQTSFSQLIKEFGTLQAATQAILTAYAEISKAGGEAKPTSELGEQIKEVDNQFRELVAAKKAYDSEGNMTADAKALAEKRKILAQEETLMTQGLAEAIKAEEKKEREKTKIAERDAKERAKIAEREAKEKAKIAEREAKEKAAADAEEAAKQKKLEDYKNDYNAAKEGKFGSGFENFNQMFAGVRTLQGYIGEEKDTQRLAVFTRALRDQKTAMDQLALSGRSLTGLYSSISSMAGAMAQQFAVLFSISAIKGFINSVAEVRGNFELQQIALESILKDKPKADEIFDKTVKLAVKSPFRIQQLITYTKQLAAYRVESDKLFDTTKRLADVSAGLGVDMQRLILAYGQVKAASFLRGQEVRQFTEAGINLYQELKEYYHEIGRGDFTTGQIVEMISKRQVEFKDVEGVINRLTNAGGLFYNMQEIQAKTLQGQISNLKDSWDVMLNDIGTSSEGVFSGAISAAKLLLDHWEILANVGKILIAVLASLKLQAMLTGTTMSNVFRLELMKGVSASMALKVALLDVGKAFKMLGRNLMKGFPIAAALAVVGFLAEKLYSLYQNHQRYKEAVNELNKAYARERSELMILTDQYRQLGSASAASDGDNDTFAKKKKLLQDLYSMMEKVGITMPEHIQEQINGKVVLIKTSLKTVTQENIDKVFNDAERRLADAQTLNYRLDLFLAGDEDYAKPLNKYDDALAALMAKSEDYNNVVASLIEKRHALTEEEKMYLDVLTKGKGAKETEEQWVIRRARLLGKIYSIEQDRSTPILTSKDFGSELAFVDKYKETAKKKLEEIFRSMPALYNKDKAFQKDFIINVVAKKDGIQNNVLRPLIEEVAKQEFGIDINFNKGKLDDELSLAEQAITNYFKHKKFTIFVDWQTFTKPSELSGLEDELDKINKRWQGIKREKEEYYASSDFVKQERARTAGFVSKQAYEEYLNKAYKEAQKARDDWGLDANDKDKKKRDKAQRDILTERVDAIKEAQKQFDDYKTMMTRPDAYEKVKGEFKKLFDYVKMPKSVLDSWNLDKDGNLTQGTINALEKIEKSVEDFKKRADIKKYIIEVKKELAKEFNAKSLEEAKNKAQELSDSFELFTRLKDKGLSEREILAMFPNIPTSYAAVGAGIENAYKNLKGDNAEKERRAAIKANTEKERKQSLANIERLLSDYREKLTDQLQLDKWYLKEKQAIYEKDDKGNYKIADAGVRNQLAENLKRQFEEKTASNKWNEFKGTDSYLRMFEDMDNLGGATLTRLKDKLESLRKEIGNLNPTAVKDIMTQIKKIEEADMKRSPFKSLINALKDVNELRKKGLTEDVLNQNILDEQEKIYSYNQEIGAIDKIILLKDKKGELDEEESSFLQEHTDLAKRTIPELQDQKEILNGMVQESRNIVLTNERGIDVYDKARKATRTTMEQLRQLQSQINNLASSTKDMLDSLGADVEGDLGTFLDIQDVIANMIIQLVEFRLMMKLAGAEAKAALGVIGYILMALEAIVSVISILAKAHDKRLEKKIAALKDHVEDLATQFEELKKHMDEAWDTESLDKYREASEKNIEMQIADYKAMINAEKAKKHTDYAKIREWEKSMKELENTRKEIQENFIESLGGFGKDSAYKDAAQAFTDAWVEAFEESGDALDALNGKMDEYISNLVKKQAMLRVAKRYLEPVFKAIDSSLADDSLGGINLVQSELENIKFISNNAMKGMDEAFKDLMDSIGYIGNRKSELSSLQQGIQGVTEKTAEAIEAYLNSMRFFLAGQRSDVAEILELLRGRNSDNRNSDTPMLAALREQTEIIRSIDRTFSSLVKAGHSKGGSGLKVFIG